MKIEIGQVAPDFTLPSHLDKQITLSDLRGMNVVLAFFPQAFTPVWSDQIPAYEADRAKFAGLNAQVLGISIDHIPVLKAWAETFEGINYPLLSDFWPHGTVAQKYGVLRSEGYTERALFILDKEGIIRYIDIHDFDDLPDNEVLLTELRKIDPQAAASAPPEPIAAALPQGGIVMYCSKWCNDCRKARAWLQARDLKYTEVDVYATPGAAAYARKLADGPLVTPTFDIDGTVVLDFDEARLEELLG